MRVGMDGTKLRYATLWSVIYRNQPTQKEDVLDLLSHAVTFACWFRFLSLGVEVGWLVVFFAEKKCIFQNSLEEDFFLAVVWCRTSWHQIPKLPTIPFCIFFARLWMGVGAPGDPKLNFWVLVADECPGPGNFDNWTCAVQEHASTTSDAIGSAERFFALLRTTHAYGFGSSRYRFPWVQGIDTNKDLIWKDLSFIGTRAPVVRTLSCGVARAG